MVKTNEWTSNDLIHYLVSVKDNLKEEEIRRLRLTAAFPKERSGAELDGQSTSRLRADQLYEPSPVLRQLGLPLIDWGTQKWRNNSEEGKRFWKFKTFIFNNPSLLTAQFLFNLGLRRYPALEELVYLCTNTDLTVCGIM